MVAVSLKKFFFKQKTAYEMCPCDWSSDVCSSDLGGGGGGGISGYDGTPCKSPTGARNRSGIDSGYVTPTAIRPARLFGLQLDGSRNSRLLM